MRPEARRWPAAIRIGALVALAISTIIFVLHAQSYFFLFDDFALVRQSADSAFATIARSPLFGFYRPLAFLFTQLEFRVFGWNAAPYALTAIVMHLLNAGLVGLLARRLGMGSDASLVAVVLFALSASAAESYFWLSGVFDRLAVAGILAALLAGASFASAQGWRNAIGWAGFGVGAAAVALLSKETAVVLPLLALATLAAGRDRPRAGRLAAYVVLLAVAVIVYVLWRQRVLSALSGRYGDWRTLISQANLPSNAVSYVLAMVRLPLPGAGASGFVPHVRVAAPFVLVATWLVVCAVLARRWPLLLAGGLAAVIAGIFPTIWAAVAPGTSASGRFMYLPGVWLALLPAAALDTAVSRPVISRRVLLSAVAAAISVSVFCQTASVIYQARVWRVASRLSRDTIEWMRPYRTLDRSLFIANFPAVFLEGPYVLKGYAFGYYFGPGFQPRIRVRRMTLRVVGDRAWFAGWIDHDGARPGERTVTLQLPIEQPTPIPQMDVLAPASGARVQQPFLLSGWSADTAGPFGCGVDAVHVYARAADRPPAFVGAAALGSPSPSLAQRLGPRFASCGWSMKVRGLPEGSYVFTVHPHDTALGDFTAPSRVPITIEAGLHPH